MIMWKIRPFVFMMIFSFIFISSGCREGRECSILEDRLCQNGWPVACVGMKKWQNIKHDRAAEFCDYMTGLLDSGNRREW